VKERDRLRERKKTDMGKRERNGESERVKELLVYYLYKVDFILKHLRKYTIPNKYIY